jgi:hypothetical protein
MSIWALLYAGGINIDVARDMSWDYATLHSHDCV